MRHNKSRLFSLSNETANSFNAVRTLEMSWNLISHLRARKLANYLETFNFRREYDESKTARFKFPSLSYNSLISLLTDTKDSQFPLLDGWIVNAIYDSWRARVLRAWTRLHDVVEDIMGLDRTLRAKELDFA